MANYTVHTMPYATNATIITPLSTCDQTVNLTQTIQDLYNFYQNNLSNPVSSEFSNISIINFSCSNSSEKYFEQIITFTKSVSIHIQIAFASVYYDYMNAYSYSLNGFHIERERRFNLSSTTLNDIVQSDACSSVEAAQDLLCPSNSTTPICITIFSNPWIFNCSENTSTSTLNTTDSTELFSTTASSILNSWQLGLVCGLSALILLIIVLLIAFFCRRHLRSKRITFSRENLLDDSKLMQKSGIPQGQAYQRATTLVQPIQTNHTAIPWLHQRINTDIHNKTYINTKSPGPYNRGTYIIHAEVHNPSIPSHIPKKTTKPTYIPNPHTNPTTPKVYQTTAISRPASGTSINQLRFRTDGLAEHILDQSDSISLDPSISTNPKKLGTPQSRRFANPSLLDESLHDEDAWMPILAVANAELDVLNRLENEQNRIKTSM